MAAATTVQEIRDAVKVTGGQVVIAGDTLGSDSISALLNEYGGQARTLTIDQAEIVSTDDDPFVKVHGELGLVGVKVTGDVCFRIDGTEAQLEMLDGSPPTGWKLEDSFPQLKGTDVAEIAPGEPRLRLLSKQTSDGPRGLSLSGGFDLPPALQIVRWFVAPDEKATLSGPIGLDGGAPVMTLSVSPSIRASLLDGLTIDLTLQHVTRAYRRTGGATPVVGAVSLLHGDLSFTHAGQPVPVPMQAAFNSATGVLELGVVPDHAFDLALGEIAHWLGGTDLGSDGLPAAYKPPGGLTLHGVTFAVGLYTQSLEYVLVSVKSDSPWNVLGETIVVSGIDLEFLLMPHGDPRLSATIAGTIELGKAVTLDVYSQLPDFLVRGGLAEGSPIDLIPLIEHLGGVSEGVQSTLQIDVLSFEAHPAGDHYTFDIDVIGDWHLTDKLAVEQLKAALRYDNSELNVRFAGRFTIGGVDVAVTAEYDSDPGGWKFDGHAADETPILVGEYIAKLADEFSATADHALPDFIASLKIEHLAVSYDTATEDFDFRFETLFDVSGKHVDLALEVKLTSQGGTSKLIFSGAIFIDSLRFALVFERAKGGDGAKPSSMFLAALKPEESIDLRALVASVDEDAGKLMPALTLGIENAMFLYRQAGDDPGTYLFGLALKLALDFETLPVVGPVFAEAKLGGIKDIQALYASADLAAGDVTAFNALMGEAKASPLLPSGAQAAAGAPVLHEGFNFAATIDLGGKPLPVTAGGSTAPPAAAPPAKAAAAPVPPSGNASWYDVKKSIGPVTLERVGLRYEDGRAWLLLDADFLLAGLSMGLQGLALGVKLDDHSLAANLDGLSIDYESGPLSIAGGFLRFDGDYLGEAKVKAAGFGLTAIGGYAPAERSFFIFVRLNAPLGGPPFFFVTGVAGGFGINRSLTVPPIDDLTSFPLLPANNTFPPTLDKTDPKSSLASTLASTEKYVHPQAGANWAAAGIDFTSFEMVDSSALVTVSFGVEFAVALLGICRVTVPKLSPEPIVYLEIALEAQIKPSEGLMAVDGRLTPASFIYAGLVHVTGGFAFYIWFAGPHEGDFVISVGGYHPRFEKPPHYPVVPRLQMIYKLGPLVIKGQCYLALTPHIVMAGLQLDATWETGALKAWFSAGLDFLLGWRPFHYEADAYVHIGVSLTIDLLFTSVSITIHVGVDLGIWGPPFGGKATIDLDIVSFTIHFGDDPRHETVDWEGFKASFLPPGQDKAAAGGAHPVRTPRMAMAAAAADAPRADGMLCTASVADGLVKELKAREATEFFSWIVDANHFVLRSNTVIPAKQATYNAHDLQTPFTREAGFRATAGEALPTPAYDDSAFPNGVTWNGKFGVLPMGLGDSAFASHHTMRLRRAPEGADHTDPTKYVEDVDDIAVGPLVKAATAALYAPADPGLNGPRLVDTTLVGLQASPMPQHPDITLKADLWAMLFDQGKGVDWHATVPAADTSDPYAATADGATLSFTLGGERVTCTGYQLTALTAPAPAAARQATVGALHDLGFALDPGEIDVADLAAYPLWDWPAIRTLGEEVAA